MDAYDEFPELAEPRLKDRAYVHLITTSEVKCHNEDLVAKLQDNSIRWPTDSDKTLSVIKRILIERGDWDTILKRGDLVYLEPAMQWNNASVYIFDGMNLQRLNVDHDIPPDFIKDNEFPFHYWKNRQVDNEFELKLLDHFPCISEDDIEIRNGIYFCFSFFKDKYKHTIVLIDSPRYHGDDLFPYPTNKKGAIELLYTLTKFSADDAGASSWVDIEDDEEILYPRY
jgi:hypothetical protein